MQSGADGREAAGQEDTARPSTAQHSSCPGRHGRHSTARRRSRRRRPLSRPPLTAQAQHGDRGLVERGQREERKQAVVCDAQQRALLAVVPQARALDGVVACLRGGGRREEGAQGRLRTKAPRTQQEPRWLGRATTQRWPALQRHARTGRIGDEPDHVRDAQQRHHDGQRVCTRGRGGEWWAADVAAGPTGRRRRRCPVSAPGVPPTPAPLKKPSPHPWRDASAAGRAPALAFWTQPRSQAFVGLTPRCAALLECQAALPGARDGAQGSQHSPCASVCCSHPARSARPPHDPACSWMGRHSSAQ